jgi:hypothetical protein
MKKGDFVTERLVRVVGEDRVMTLGGTPDNWVCTWQEAGEKRSAHYRPEQLEPLDKEVERQ